MRFHFSASEVSPPATINPVAGHMTQSKVFGYVSSGIIPCDSRNPGKMNQLIAVPRAIEKQMRKPTSSPEPNDNRLQLMPILMSCIPGTSHVSGKSLRKLRSEE